MSQKQIVGAILVDPHGLLLLQQRDQQSMYYPNYWSLFGGKVKPGETDIQALLRELYEELRLTPSDISYLWLFQTTLAEDSQSSQSIFVVHLQISIDQLELYEGQAMELFRLDQVFELPLAFDVRPILRTYQKIA